MRLSQLREDSRGEKKDGQKSHCVCALHNGEPFASILGKACSPCYYQAMVAIATSLVSPLSIGYPALFVPQYTSQVLWPPHFLIQVNSTPALCMLAR